MAFTGLGQFVETLDRKGLLVRVKDFVDPVYEIAEITDRYCKQPNGGKAILFESTGTAFPVLTNAFGSDERLALALGFSSPSEVARELECLLFALTSKILPNGCQNLFRVGASASR
jgi:4-hydroxy-3-polyprenylbenzoate decarboxylase